MFQAIKIIFQLLRLLKQVQLFPPFVANGSWSDCEYISCYNSIPPIEGRLKYTRMHDYTPNVISAIDPHSHNRLECDWLSEVS